MLCKNHVKSEMIHLHTCHTQGLRSDAWLQEGEKRLLHGESLCFIGNSVDGSWISIGISSMLITVPCR